MRNRRAITFLGLAIILGLVASFVAQRWLESQRPIALRDGTTTRSVVVARMDAGVGSALSAELVQTADWPEKHVPVGAFAKPSALDGRVVRRALAAGEPVLESSLLPSGAAAGLLSVIGENRRAVSVKVDDVIGVAGFVRPGARVDVLATLRRIDQPNSMPYSKVILQDVPVLAVDQRMEEAKNGEPELVNVVTLEVDPSQSEQLIYSAHEGRLQLALRNPGDNEIVKTSSIGVADLLSTGHRRKNGHIKAGPSVEVLRGSTREIKGL